MHCPQCTSKIDGEAILCPRCGVDQNGPDNMERVCDVFLMGMSDPASFDHILEFLKARTFIESPDELMARLSNSPTLVTKAVEPRRARRLRESLERLGGIVEIRERRMTDRGSAKKVVRDGKTESPSPPQEAGKKGSMVYLGLFLLSLAAVGYLGYRQNVNGDGDTVRVAVRKIASQFPGNLGKRKGSPPALPTAEQVATVDEASTEGAALNNQGVAFMNEGRFEDAVRVFEEALFHIPDDSTILKNLHQGWLQLGYHELKEGNFEKAILALDQATKILDESPDAYKAMGMAALELGDETRAEQYFRQYIEREPDDPAVAKILGELLYKQNKLEEGIRYLKLYSESNPDDLQVKALVDKAGREAAVEEDFEAKTGRHFDVRYDGVENMDSGYLVVGLLEDAYQRIGAQLNYYPAERLTTILYSDEDFRA
ncbi:MAG: tetratricopeptide repeat protein, partial [bacterium]|nr:tetratricopeptide repeat protein [bacterium]